MLAYHFVDVPPELSKPDALLALIEEGVLTLGHETVHVHLQLNLLVVDFLQDGHQARDFLNFIDKV